MSDEVTVRIRKSRLRMVLVALATASLVVPTTVWAADQFNDVPNSNVFHDDIAWMADNGVTAGCNPPANDEFCPSDNVTREQMSAFMRRLDSKNVFTTFAEAESIAEAAAPEPIEDWHEVGTTGEPSFTAPWENYGGNYQRVGFRIDHDGVVHLRGGASRPSNSAGSFMFTLPPDYRPSERIEVFSVASTDGGGDLAPDGGVIEINSSGQVFVYGDTDDRYVSLNGVYFDTLG